ARPAAAAGEWVLWQKTDSTLPTTPAIWGEWKIQDAYESRSECNAYLDRKHEYWEQNLKTSQGRLITIRTSRGRGRFEITQFTEEDSDRPEKARLWLIANVCLPGGVEPP